MPTVITGTDGVSQVQAGAVESGDLPAGSVIQVVRATDTSQEFTSSTSFIDSGISVTITPVSSTSVVLLVWSFYANTSNTGRTLHAQITDSSNIAISGAEDMRVIVNNDIINSPVTLFAYATPATTSAVTYKGRYKATGVAVTINNDRNTGQLYAIEVAA